MRFEKLNKFFTADDFDNGALCSQFFSFENFGGFAACTADDGGILLAYDQIMGPSGYRGSDIASMLEDIVLCIPAADTGNFSGKAENMIRNVQFSIVRIAAFWLNKVFRGGRT